MKRINVLQPHIANQIAAGEVVERPASVVKELVENAIDAEATSVTVEIQNGGMDYIRVTDNGAGISAEDCLIAFERHATSKINLQEDLAHIETLGFRGEALASIAAVAQVELHTRPRENETGMHVRIEGGECKFEQPAGCPEGTVLEVENLFYNVPARRKFLKSARTEGSYVGEYLSRMILARPDISFRFLNSGKEVYHSVGDGVLKNAVYCVYGSEVLPHIKEVSFDDGYLRLTGFIGTAELARPNRAQQSFFLNGRYIRSMLLSNALYRAYDTRLMGGRYPFAILNITVASREVDVNVHPAKLEARFAQESRVASAITDACTKALGPSFAPVVHLSVQDGAAQAVQLHDRTGADEYKAGFIYVGQSNDMRDENAILGSVISKPAAFVPMDMSEPAPASMRVKESLYEIPHFQVLPSQKAQAPAQTEIPVYTEQERFGELPIAVIGQAFDSYWIVQQGEKLFFIDQHAAHERKLYERFMAQEGEQSSQTLLSSELIQLTHAEHDVLMHHQDVLQSLGFELEPFGATSIRVLAVPALFAQVPVGAMLRDALEVIQKQGRATTQDLHREAIIQAACKHAVKAGDPLDKAEILALINAFSGEGLPMTCPHGRPVMIQLSRKEIKKLFKRIV